MPIHERASFDRCRNSLNEDFHVMLLPAPNLLTYCLPTNAKLTPLTINKPDTMRRTLVCSAKKITPPKAAITGTVSCSNAACVLVKPFNA